MKERIIPYSEDARRLISGMLQKDPEQRPTIFDVSEMVDSLLHKLIPRDDDDNDDHSDDEVLQVRLLLDNLFFMRIKVY